MTWIMTNSVRKFWKIFFIAVGVFVLFLILCDLGALGEMPSISDLQNPTASLSSEVYAEDGSLMGKFFLQDRVNVDFKDISPHVIHALVATEDERFYDHCGIDGRSLLRAIKGLGRDGGASTITMQTAKNLFTNYSSNFFIRMIQKFKESIIAIKLERNFTKNEILALYLNTVPFGDNVYGIRNAAKTFFQKEPDRLNVQEAAVLVGMLKASTTYNPRINPKKALERRNTVLDQMVRNNYLASSEAEDLKAQPIVLNYKKLDETTGLGPYFRMVLGEQMKDWCKTHKKSNGDNYNLFKDGLKIYTTINPKMQIYAEEAVAKHLSYMQKILNAQNNIRNGKIWKGFANVVEAAAKESDRWKYLKTAGLSDEEANENFRQPTDMKIFAWNQQRQIDTVMSPYDSIRYCKQFLQAGFMVMDPLTGEVKAWVGGIDFKTFKFDHVNANTKRQVGSAIKPLLYSLAIENAGFTPNTTVYDLQQNFGDYGMVPATANSCSGRAMPMVEALAYSKNGASAYIMKHLDPVENNSAKKFVEFLHTKCGVVTPIYPNPSIALGTCEISLYEMMQAYSMLPGRGFNVQPMFITRIEDRNGNVLENFAPNRKQVISDVTAYAVSKMMQAVVKEGTARGLGGYDIGGDVAGKTGTTQDNSDAWFMGFTPQLMGGVWVGCDDRFIRLKSNEGEGAEAAMPIWAYFFEKLMENPSAYGLDAHATFVKPNNMNSSMDFTYDNTPAGDASEAQDSTMTDDNSTQQYMPENMDKEDLGPESQLPDDQGGTESRKSNKSSVNSKGGNTSSTKKPKSKSKSNKDDRNMILPSKQPKAVMPKKSHHGGNGDGNNNDYF